MNTFSILDYAIFIGYACVIMFIGLFVSRTKKGQAKSSQDYFLASRSLALLQIFRQNSLSGCPVPALLSVWVLHRMNL